MSINPWNAAITAAAAVLVGFALWATWPWLMHGRRRHRFIVELIRRLTNNPEAHVFHGEGHQVDSLKWWNGDVHAVQRAAGRVSYAYGWMSLSSMCLLTTNGSYWFWPRSNLFKKWTTYSPLLVVYQDGTVDTEQWFFVEFDEGTVGRMVATDDPPDDLHRIHRLGTAKLYPPER